MFRAQGPSARSPGTAMGTSGEAGAAIHGSRPGALAGQTRPVVLLCRDDHRANLFSTDRGRKDESGPDGWVRAESAGHCRWRSWPPPALSVDASLRVHKYCVKRVLSALTSAIERVTRQAATDLVTLDRMATRVTITLDARAPVPSTVEADQFRSPGGWYRSRQTQGTRRRKAHPFAGTFSFSRPNTAPSSKIGCHQAYGDGTAIPGFRTSTCPLVRVHIPTNLEALSD